MIKREKKALRRCISLISTIWYLYTNETNRSKLSSRKFPWNQYLLIFEGKLEEVALEKLELVEQPIPRASIRQFVNLIPSRTRTRSWRVANLVSKTGGGGGGGWRKKEERIFFFSSPPRKSTSDSRANERVKVRRQRASVSANISSRAEYPTEILEKLSKI